MGHPGRSVQAESGDGDGIAGYGRNQERFCQGTVAGTADAGRSGDDAAAFAGADLAG